MTEPTHTSPAGTRYPFSVIRRAMREHDGQVLDFAFGVDRPVAPTALAELVRAAPEAAIHRASHTESSDLVGRAVEMLAREYGIDRSPECILPTPGGRAAISAIVSCLLSQGDVVLATEPGYPSFSRVAAEAQARIAAVWLDPEQGFGPDMGAVAQVADTVCLTALNYPNNPTGAALDPAMVRLLADLLPPRSIIFNDATYGPLVYEGPPRSLLADDIGGGLEQEVLELHSLSKLFGCEGLSVSFLVGSPSIVHRIRDYSEFAWTPPSGQQTALAAYCLSNGGHLQQLRREFGERVGRLRRTLIDLGLEPYPAPSGLYVLCPVPPKIGGRPVSDAWQAAEELLATAGLAVMPFAASPQGYLRFSAMHRPEDLAALSTVAGGLLHA